MKLGSIKTNSSLAVGWIATELSKSCLVAPIVMAMEMPYIISSTFLPMQWHPTTISLSSDSTWQITLKNDFNFFSSLKAGE